MSLALLQFFDKHWFELLLTVASVAAGSYVTAWYYRKALRQEERDREVMRQQVLKDDLLVLKTGLDNPQNALERFKLAEDELAQAKRRYTNARDKREKRIASLEVRTCLIRRLKVAQELPEYQRPSLEYGTLKEETDRELERLISLS